MRYTGKKKAVLQGSGIEPKLITQLGVNVDFH